MKAVLNRLIKLLLTGFIVVCFIPIITELFLMLTSFKYSDLLPNLGLWPFFFSWMYISLASLVLFAFFKESRRFAATAFILAWVWEIYLVVSIDGNL